MAYLASRDASISGYPMSIYHKVNLKADRFQCDLAVPTEADIPAGEYVFKEAAAGRFLKVVLQGSYEFLELAWHVAYSHIHIRKYKVDSSQAALEVYENDPNQVASTNDVITALYIPLK